MQSNREDIRNRKNKCFTQIHLSGLRAGELSRSKWACSYNERGSICRSARQFRVKIFTRHIRGEESRWLEWLNCRSIRRVKFDSERPKSRRFARTVFTAKSRVNPPARLSSRVNRPTRSFSRQVSQPSRDEIRRSLWEHRRDVHTDNLRALLHSVVQRHRRHAYNAPCGRVTGIQMRSIPRRRPRVHTHSVIMSCRIRERASEREKSGEKERATKWGRLPIQFSFRKVC